MAGTDFEAEPDGSMPRIVKTEDILGSTPRIDGHRIGVFDVYQRYVEGDESPQEIASKSGISAAEVHAALAYAFSNLDEMRAIEEANQTRFEERSASRVVPDESD